MGRKVLSQNPLSIPTKTVTSPLLNKNLKKKTQKKKAYSSNASTPFRHQNWKAESPHGSPRPHPSRALSPTAHNTATTAHLRRVHLLPPRPLPALTQRINALKLVCHHPDSSPHPPPALHQVLRLAPHGHIAACVEVTSTPAPPPPQHRTAGDCTRHVISFSVTGAAPPRYLAVRPVTSWRGEGGRVTRGGVILRGGGRGTEEAQECLRTVVRLNLQKWPLCHARFSSELSVESLLSVGTSSIP
ncbi:uncharacterized protein A4U43_C06F11920 [Asparagus officinalis]|uniref:Uncharacterized protein n=1 Tax=Asparagus officinalis TaxID=4686 RepID=A0A5P1EM99_ASPOF|nr:uncharacterized protein A4U43_C06F11920 [Asparagus officinalis]